MAQQNENTLIPTVRAVLDRLTNEDLKDLLNLLPTSRKPTRKAELIAAIEEHLDGEKLRALWERLN